MKLEISVKAELDAEKEWVATVEKVLVKPNDVVKAGDRIMLLRKG